MQKATTTPRWMAENFKPKGNRGAVSKALRLALGAAGKPIQNRSATGATSFEPEISTHKSSADAVLPLVADGSRLSWPGALEAIDRAARAFNLEGLLQHQASKPDEVKRVPRPVV